MIELSQLPEAELHEGYRAYSAEINRRHELQRIPAEISELAQQGREMGIEESTLAEALINAPEVEVEVEAEAEAETTKGK